MDVTQLIELTNHLSTQHEAITAKEKALYLEALNVANNEFYQVASSGLRTLTQQADIFLSTNEPFNFALPNDLLQLRQVYAGEEQLISADIDKYHALSDQYYLILNNAITCDITIHGPKFFYKIDDDDGQNKRYITIFYVPNPIALSEDGFNNTLTTPVYPSVFHHYLAIGATYYFYLSNKIFLEKMAFVQAKWEEAKILLQNYIHRGQ